MNFLRYFAPLLLAFGSCQNGGTKIGADKASQKSERLLRLSFQTEVRSLDPRIGIDWPSCIAVKMLFEGLIRIGPQGIAEPAIAKSYEISEDFLTYTFHLRPCTWSNGDEVTAFDFEYAWKKIIEPGGENLGAQNFYPIKNVKEIIKGKKPIESVGIKVLDEKTLQVELIHPTPYFLEVLAVPSFFPVNSKWDQNHPGWANQEGKAFVSNGPYILQRHRIDNEIVMRKNPNYWDAEQVSMPGIHIAIVKDGNTQLDMFEKGEVDWLGKPLSKMPVDIKETLGKGRKVQYYNTLGLYWYFINVEAFPLNNKNIRKALAYGINREAITKYVLEGQETPAMALLPGMLSTQQTPFFEDHDKEMALKLFNEGLDELGISKEELPEITINYSSVAIHQRVSEELQQQLKNLFNIKVRLEQQEWKVHYGKLQKGNYQIGGMAWQSWLRDPIYIMQTFRDKGDGVNMSKWENTRYQALLTAAEKEPDPTRRRKLFNKAEALILDEMPVIPVYFTTCAYAKNPQLKNVYLSELYEVDFRWSYFEED